MQSNEPVTSDAVLKSPYDPYRRVLLNRVRIKQLSTPRPWRALLDIWLCWLFIIGAFSLVAFYKTWWATLLAIPLIGNRYYALFIIGHDGMHRRLFPNLKTNDFWTDLLIFAPIGAITRLNNRNHLAHHQHLGTRQDPDLHKHGCFNKADRISLIGFLSGFTSIWNSLRAVFFARSKPDRQSIEIASTDTYKIRDVALLVGWFLALSGGLTWFIGWWAYPALWLMPVYVFMYLAANVRSFAEHSHPEADHQADSHRLITYTSSRLERSLLAPMNMNYHTVHHLWPSIPYCNLPVADREIRSNGEALGLEWRGSYLGYLLRYWRALPLPECAQTPLQPGRVNGT